MFFTEMRPLICTKYVSFELLLGFFKGLEEGREGQKGLQVCYCLWGVPSRPSPGSYPGPVQVPSRVRGGPVQIRHVLCFTVFRTHPGPEVGAIPAPPGPILLPSVPYRIGPGRAETDFLATSERGRPWYGTFAKPKGHFTEGMSEKC